MGLAIDVTPVADAHDNDDKLPVTDSVDYPVGSDADAVQLVNTGQFLNAAGPRVILQRLKSADNTPSHVGRKAVQNLADPRIQSDSVLHPLALPRLYASSVWNFAGARSYSRSTRFAA